MKKHLIVIVTVFFILILGVSGCTDSFQDVIIDDSYYQDAPKDPVTINKVQLFKNIIYFNISYSGGCSNHEFQLITSSFMESDPVQVDVLLSHEDNDDPCDMWITENLGFDLLPLKKSWQYLYQEKSGKIILNIQGWNDLIYYEF
jgi:hypothetical protein